MKNKIIKSLSDEKTGLSMITIQNKYGIFRGVSLCADEDMEHFSSFAGLRYAENRAAAEYAKLRYQQEKVKLKTIQNLIKDLEHKKTEIPADIQRALNIKLRDYSASVSYYKNMSIALKDSIKKQDTIRQKILSWTKKDKES